MSDAAFDSNQPAGFIRRLLRPLVGDVRWQAPGWMRGIGNAVGFCAVAFASWVRSDMRRAAIAAAVGVALIAGGAAGKIWYDKQPKPLQVTYEVVVPEPTPVDQPNAKPEPMLIKFSDSVATLAGVGKEVTTGIAIEPKIDGTWKWEDDRTLSLNPKADWPVGAEVVVTLAKKGLLAEQVRLKSYQAKFRTAPFVAKITEAQFYQDPADPASKKIVATVNFTHPVDVADFEKRIVLREEGRDGVILGIGADDKKFKVTYDKFKVNAYIHSEPMPIPSQPVKIAVTIEAGARSSRGGNGTTEAVKQAVTVPGLYSLALQKIELTLAENERLEPDRILMVNISADTNEKEVAGKVRAWVLPIHHPGTKPEERKGPFNWSNPQQIGPEILAQSEPLKLEAVPAEREHVQQHGFKYSADAGRYVYVKVEKGMKSFGGYMMEKERDGIVRVQRYPRQLRIASQGALLALSGEKKLAVLVRDVEGVRYEIGRLLPQQLQHLVTMSEGGFAKPNFNNNFDDDNLAERYTQIEDMPPSQPGKPNYLALDLGKYLDGDGGKRGIFFVKVESYDPQKKRTTGAVDKRLIVVTDLGMVVKRAIDGSQDVFVQSIATGQPVAGVSIEVMGRNGQVIASQTTDVTGRARLPDFAGFTREKAPAVYVARKANDTSFLPYDRSDRVIDFSRFDVGGVNSSADAGKLSAYLFSDRGIYRPGEEIRVGMIVKSADWATRIAGAPLEYELTDARGLVLRKDKIKLSQSGFEEVRHATQDTSPTGDYTVSLYIVKDGQRDSQLGSVTVKVQEFMPDRLKMSARFTRESVEGWVTPQDLKANVSLQNLFGTPAEARRVTATMTLQPALPSFPKYRDYQFHDPQFAKEGFTEPLPESKTSDKGEVELDLNLARFAKATYRLHLITQGFEADGGRGVSAEAATLVSNMPFLVGYKADGDLNYVSRASKRSVELIAIDPAAKKTDAKDLKLIHFERKFVSVLTRQPNNTYKYESREKRVQLDEKPFTIAAAGSRVALATDAPGSYAYIVRDAQGQDLARVSYEVAGAANLTRSLEKNAELQVKLSKKDFSAGEEIELSIQAPYVGSGLITIERERVYSHVWFTTKTTASTQKITLPKDFEGNGYVTVTFIRDAGSDEIYSSPLAYGVQPFSVNLDRRKLKTTVKVPDLVKPGDTIKFRHSTDRPSRIVVFAVDEGILQVARYKTADPLGFFFQKRALEVKTFQILDLILPEFKRFMAAAAPGGDGDGALGKHLNPFKRKTDKPVAFWSGIIESGPQERELTWQVPETFNGTLRVMAVAVNEDSIGVFEKKTLSRGDFVLSPNAPLTVTPGDEFDVSVGVANNVTGSGADAQIAVTMATSPHLEIVGATSNTLKVGELREGVTSFKVRVKDELGAGTLSFSASGMNKSAKLGTSISVRPAQPYITLLTAGTVRNGNAEAPVTRNLYPHYRKLETSISHVPLGLAHGLTAYLQGFQYSCTEQLVSMGLPALILGNRPEFGYVKSKEYKTLDDLIQVLRGRQNGEGAFGLWAANAHVVDIVSVYAMHFLIEARERGRNVPQDIIVNGNNYLRSIASGDGGMLTEERTRAYAIYLLTRQGIVTTNFAAALQKRLETTYAKAYAQDISTAYLAASYQLMKQQRLADQLIAGAGFGTPVSLTDAYSDPLSRDAQLLYLLARHFPERLVNIKPEALNGMVKEIANGGYNTHSSGRSILAFDAFASAAEKLPAGTLAVSEVLRNNTARPVSMPPGLIPRASFSVDAAKLQFANKADLPAYYVVEQTGFDRNLPDTEIKKGFEILREYVDAKGNPVKSVKVGDEIEVRLKFRAIGREAVDNAALVDLLPGGFDLVLNPAPAQPQEGEGESRGEREGRGENENRKWRAPIGIQRSTWQPDYADLREDRVVLYGMVSKDIKEFAYRIKATNTGTFVVPPAYGESMYDRSVQARSLGGKITVEKR
ncbi:MAG: MG2 domain-containing protein [Burkholderiales bacterium]